MDKPKYRPWPKKKTVLANGSPGRKEYDKEKIKELYLGQNNYAWQDFCKLYNFNPLSNTRQELGFKHWQKDWLFARMEEQDENAMASAIVSRKEIMARRARHPKEWIEFVDAHKGIHKALFNKIATDLQHDETHKKEIELGDRKAKNRLTLMGWSMMVQSLDKLLQIERQVLLLTATDAPKMLSTPEDERKAQTDEATFIEDYQRQPVQIMGLGQVPRDELTAAMSQWYDQQPEQLPDIPTTAVVKNEEEPE